MIEESFTYCRVCASRKRITPARYSLDDGEVSNWTLCKKHYDLIKYDLPLRGVIVTELPLGEVDGNVSVADYNRKMENDARS